MKIGDKNVKLVFDLGAWEEIEEIYGSIDAMTEQLQSGKQIIKNVLTILEILAHDKDVTREELRRELKPADIREATEEILAAIYAGMGMESVKVDEDGPVDVVLEEINKKKQPET